MHLVKEYIGGLWRSQKYGNEVITISRETLLKIERIDYNYLNVDYVRLGLSKTIDLSCVKSLGEQFIF